jgi:osmotically-inducible protein OsmY
MGVASAVTTIVGAARLDDYQSTADSARALADLALTARVQATLLRTLGTPSLLINVLAKEREVYLRGTLSATIADEEIRTLVESVAGVEKVLTDFETMPSEILRYG